MGDGPPISGEAPPMGSGDAPPISMIDPSLRESLILFGLFKLSPRQKAVLTLTLKYENKISASSMAKIANEEFNIPLSSFWFALRDLRRLKLIEFGDGSPIKLTEAGRVIAQALSGVRWWERG
ncbi:MAG: hypothetical protein LM591_03080 [Candidatus Korarchaeum sp.]|jgi:hypothetical protein|nr:hypothetical protein [Candidatus Korarchaeum sp.]